MLPFTPVKLNFFAELQPRPILVKNGVIYILEKTPLLPPLSPLSQLFLFPDPFSTLTSAVQKTGLAYPLLPHYGNHSVPLLVDSIGEGDDEVDERVVTALNEIVDEKKKWSKQSFTVFAPTNRSVPLFAGRGRAAEKERQGVQEAGLRPERVLILPDRVADPTLRPRVSRRARRHLPHRLHRQHDVGRGRPRIDRGRCAVAD